MCKVDIYPFLNPDGTQGRRTEKTRCETARRRGERCANPEVYRHALTGPHLPPSPLSTPRSGTPNYRSGDESAGSSGSHRRRSGVCIEVNGRRVYNGERRRRTHNPERVVIVDSPPTPRTPPQAFNMPSTAPPSPSPMDAGRRVHLPYRPIIVDERTIRRPHVTIATPEFVGHRRTPSNSSHRSRGSSASDEERRWDQFTVPRRPSQAEAEREAALQAQRLAARIAAANAEIKRRPAVPIPSTPPQRSSTTYIRPAVEVRPILRPPPSPLDAVRNERQYQVAEERRRQEEEDEAQRQRLRERMTPQRRATVGGGSRRTRVVYPDGVYRWE